MEVAQFDKITTAIQRVFDDSGRAQDMVFQASPLFALLNSKGKKKVAGGRKIQANLNYAKNTTVGSYSGWDVLDTTPQDTLTHAVYDWSQYSAAISFDGATIAKNNDANSVIDLVSHETELAMDSLKDAMAIDMFLDGTGNDSKDILGLAAIVSASGTLGNISRGTYDWWKAEADAVAEAITIDKIRHMVNTIKGASSGSPQMTGVVDLIMSGQDLYESVEGLILPHVRIAGTQMTGKLGFQSLQVAGTELAWDGHMDLAAVDQSDYMYFLSTKYMGMRVMPSLDFKFTKYREPVNQDGRVAFIKWMGQLIATNCRRLGVFTNKTA